MYTWLELHSVKAKFFLWGQSPVCGWFQVKGLRDSDMLFFYKSDHSSTTAVGLSPYCSVLNIVKLSDMSWWLFYLPNNQNQIYVGSSVAFVLPISGPWTVQNWVHYFSRYLHIFGLQVNMKIGSTDFSVCMHTCISMFTCACLPE